MTNSAFNEYVYFEGKKVARRDGAGDVFYYLDDMLGSSTGMVEIAAGQTGAVFCYDADFYPYGGEKVVTNTCPQNYKWTGKERDAETGNDDFDARYYSSVYGRFLSADWSAVPAPVPYANLINPQTLNLYAIVRDNPESFADLDGHEPVPGPMACGADGCGSNNNSAAQDQKKVEQQNQTTSQPVTEKDSGVVTVSRTTTVTTPNADGSQTTTITTTSLMYSNRVGEEGKFLSAENFVQTFDGNSKMPFLSIQKISEKDAKATIGGQASLHAQGLASEPSLKGHIAAAFQRDMAAHPGKYVAAGAGVASIGAGAAGMAATAALLRVGGLAAGLYDAVTHANSH